jgi:hypothetical protein
MKTVVSVLALLGCVFAAAAAAKDYRGKAQALMPTPKETAFPNLLQFTKAKKPGGTLAPGWQAGVAAIYQKGTTKSPIEAAATVYVYSNAATAKTAWQHVCTKCSHTVLAGLRMRYRSGRANGLLTFQSFTYCHNVYAAVVGQGAETATKLGNDVGTIIAGIYRRAVHFGMSACA